MTLLRGVIWIVFGIVLFTQPGNPVETAHMAINNWSVSAVMAGL